MLHSGRQHASTKGLRRIDPRKRDASARPAQGGVEQPRLARVETPGLPRHAERAQKPHVDVGTQLLCRAPTVLA